MRLLTFDTGDTSAGPRVGRPTPVSDVLVDLTRRIHAGELQPDEANLDLVRQQLAR